MLQLRYIALLSALIVVKTRAQGGGTTAAGDSYVCVPAGYCNNGGVPVSPGIDPRIVTPGDLCPSGQIPCYTQGPSSRCGERFVTPTPSTANGPAPAGAHPWQAYIRNSTNIPYAGSGVLIDNYHILTAAHKVWGDRLNPTAVTVIMGVSNPSVQEGIQTRTASRIYVHEQYTNFPLLQNDIAIIRVNTPFSLSANNINSLCLPASNPAVESASAYLGPPPQTCIVAGWGETSFMQNDHPTNPMKQVNVNPVSIAQCRGGLLPVLPTVDTYLDQTGGEVCAGGQADLDACTFDGGAPLTCPNTGKGTMVGLVIWGKGCGTATVPGVYVSVPFYRTWIDAVIQGLNTGTI